MNNELACYDYRELGDGSYECVCPNPDCQCVIIIVGNEPFPCDGCDTKFILGDKDEISKKVCKNCRYFTYVGTSRISKICLKCNKQDHFEPREGMDDET